MDELIPLRTWLLSRKGHWTQLAEKLDLSTKTIQRVANEPTRSVNFRTYTLLKNEMLSERSEQAAQEEGV
ncbi:hypothetical protein ADM96_20225 [Burkholderia sp. ST111]|nr:hypothetical protein ADM96_20225 [Burkholderia sp. ST111]